MRVVKLLDIFERAFILLRYEINRDTFTTKSATTSNSAIYKYVTVSVNTNLFKTFT